MAKPGKYDPLRDFLKGQTLREFVLSFGEIERIIGDSLPKTAERNQWWENNVNPVHDRTQRKAWRSAGFDAFLMPRSKVRFRRAGA